MLKNFVPWKITTGRATGSILFIISFLAISWYYDYHQILTYKPQSIHKWRQSDCASITLNYYQHGMSFFHPEVHNLASDNRTTGYAAGESPILYYFIASLYKLFGHHDLIYRLVNTLILFLGLFALFKLLEEWFHDTIWGILLALLFFTSPVVVYYGNNYLTDTTSFAFVLMGWYFFFKFYTFRKQRQIYFSLLFFTIAGLLKVTAAINVFAILGLFFINYMGWLRMKQEVRITLNLKTFLPFIFYFMVMISWYLYAIHYNRLHQTEYFSTQIWPIWELSGETILWIRDQMKQYWLKDYFHFSVQILFFAAFIFIVLKKKKTNPVLTILTLLIFAGVVLFTILWFYAFGNHDYYIIGLFILPVFILLSLGDSIKKMYPRFFSSLVPKVAFALFLLFNIYYAGQRLEWRYKGWINDYPSNKDLYNVTPYLRSLGIGAGDKVISLPDPTPCYSLYLMNQKGWTEHYRNNTDSLKIEQSIALGAKYLVVTGSETQERPYLQHFTRNKLGQFGNIYIFSLINPR